MTKTQNPITFLFWNWFNPRDVWNMNFVVLSIMSFALQGSSTLVVYSQTFSTHQFGFQKKHWKFIMIPNVPQLSKIVSIQKVQRIMFLPLSTRRVLHLQIFNPSVVLAPLLLIYEGVQRKCLKTLSTCKLMEDEKGGNPLEVITRSDSKSKDQDTKKNK